jgi:anaerobic magnesium-protoporphyrin IX monomethyl ester cyclase
LSLLYPATPLARKGYRVAIVDQRVDHQWPQTLRAILRRGEVLCVGISSMTCSQIVGGLAASHIVKETSPETPVIWGGVHASLIPEQTVLDPRVDAVIVGEGEATLLETVDTLAAENRFSELPGLTFKSNGQLTHGGLRPHLDPEDLPPLAYDLLDVRDYTRSILGESSEDWIALLTSRGCPYGCTYCYSEAFSLRQWRALSPERTLEDIERIIRDFSIRHFFLFDDNFFVDPKRVHEICRLIVERRLSIEIHNANWRVDSILGFDEDRMRLLKASGFEKVFVGVESGSDEILERIGKGFTSSQVLEANRKLMKAGISPVYAFMTGFPFESRRDTRATLHLMSALLSENPEAQIPGMSLYAPFPGTPLFEECLRRGMKAPDTLQAWSAISYTEVNFDGFDPRERRAFRKAALLSQFLDAKNLRGKGKIKKLFFSLIAAFARLRVRLGLETLVPEGLIVRYSQRRKRDK